MNRVSFLLIFLLALSFVVSGVPLSKIGVVNFSKIVEDYFAESFVWREIDELRGKYESGKQAILAEIDELNYSLLNAQNENNEYLVLQLEDRIYNKQEYLKEYHTVWQNRINTKVEEATTSTAFTAEIYRAVKRVAEESGYSLVLRSIDPNLIWYSHSVDMTEDVLERLRR